LYGLDLYFKCENFQKIGAFKIRGGMNASLQLTKEQLEKGVVTHSSGNHAQALAFAAKMLGIKAYIVMPESSPQVKVNAVRGYGAEVTICASNQAARESTLEAIVERTGATFIHPYDNDEVITGQATCVKEIIDAISPKYFIIANAFNTHSIGHFKTYEYENDLGMSSIVDQSKISAIFKKI